MNFENIFILPNVIGERSRRRFGGIFIRIPKVTFARSSLLYTSLLYSTLGYSKLRYTSLTYCSLHYNFSIEAVKTKIPQRKVRQAL